MTETPRPDPWAEAEEAVYDPFCEADEVWGIVDAARAADADRHQQEIATLRATVEQQAQQIADLKAVLKPFGALADCYDPPEGDDHEPTWDRKPTLGQLRAVRQALETP